MPDTARDAWAGKDERAQIRDAPGLRQRGSQPHVGADSGIRAVGARRFALRAAADRERRLRGGQFGLFGVGLHRGAFESWWRRSCFGGVARDVGGIEHGVGVDEATDRPAGGAVFAHQHRSGWVRPVDHVVEFVFAKRVLDGVADVFLVTPSAGGLADHVPAGQRVGGDQVRREADRRFALVFDLSRFRQTARPDHA